MLKLFVKCRRVDMDTFLGRSCIPRGDTRDAFLRCSSSPRSMVRTRWMAVRRVRKSMATWRVVTRLSLMAWSSRSCSAETSRRASWCSSWTPRSSSEYGEEVEIVDYRKDPKVSQTYVVETREHACALIQAGQVIDTFELEEGQTLADLEVGDPKFF
jgi:hypothetical protein